MKPLCIELFCGTFGWSAGWLELGGWAVGFDIEHLPHHGEVPRGADLVIQDVLTIHGSQFRDASLILASPPCQAFSWRAMPWKLAKALGPDEAGLPKPAWWDKPQTSKKPEVVAMDEQERAEWELWKRKYPRPAPSTALFDACFRIQREASEAAGHHIPMVVENVRGAQPWVGRSAWNFGSFHLWGDVPALMPITLKRAVMKNGITHRSDGSTNFHGTKNGGGSWFAVANNTDSGHGRNPVHALSSELKRRIDTIEGAAILAEAARSAGNTELAEALEARAEQYRIEIADGLKVPGMNFHDHEKTGQPGRSFQSAAVQRQDDLIHFAAERGYLTEREGQKIAAYSDPLRNGGKGVHLTRPRENIEGRKQEGSGPIWFDTGIASHGSKSSARKAASAQIAKIPLALSSHLARTFKPGLDMGRGIVQIQRISTCDPF